jgi:protein-tyrosine phosphatase
MAEFLDWQSVDAPRAVIQYLVRTLTRRELVLLPTETGPIVVANAAEEHSVRRLRDLADELALEVALPGGSTARDWMPGLGLVSQRLARRAWPGPLTLAGPLDSRGLVGRLPHGVQKDLRSAGSLRLGCPGHEAVLEVVREADLPLVFARWPSQQRPAELLARAGEQIRLVLEDQQPTHQQPPTVVTVGSGADQEWTVIQPGVFTEEQLRLLAACLIVFVCTGNTCRSPLAEVLCKKHLAQKLGCGVEELPARGYVVLSAGLSASPGAPAAPEAVEVARDKGADLSQHRSRPLSADLAARADYLLAMTQTHVRAINEYYPTLGAQPRLLDPDGSDLSDPIGSPRPVYEDCAQQITRYLQDFLGALTQTSET